jgi:hypothetical protein
MSLRVWNLLQDPYDHAQLADNWLRVDQHDHTPGRGVQVPTEGIADSAITQAKVAPGVTATPTPGSVTLGALAPEVITDYGYALAAWKPIFSAGVTFTNSHATDRYGINRIVDTPSSGSAIGNQSTFYLNPADVAAGSRTVEYRVRVQWITNATAPTSTFTFGLASVNALSGGTYSVSGSNITGSTVAVTAPAASSSAVVESSAFTLSSGIKGFACSLSAATPAAGSNTSFRLYLQYRQV